MSYYYLVASLPAITVGNPPPVAPAQFRTVCSEHLEPQHLRELDAVFTGRGASRFARQWQRVQAVIAHACALARAPGHGIDPASLTAPDQVPDLALARAVQDALADPDPERREQALDAVRLATLEQLTFAAPFELEAVLAYGLRLEICARWAARTPERGRTELAAQVDALLHQFEHRGQPS